MTCSIEKFFTKFSLLFNVKTSPRAKFEHGFCNNGQENILYYPVMLSHFSPASVKTDRAVRIQ